LSSSDCRHKWVVTEWIGNNENYERPKQRYCEKCGKKQSISYLAGDILQWEDESHTKKLYFNEESPKKHPKSFKISQKNANMIQYALILGVLFTTLYVFMIFRQGDIMGFFGSQAFLYVALSYIFIYIFWQGITNKLSRFPVEIVESSVKQKKSKHIQTTLLKTDRKAYLWSIIGYTLSMAFTFMVMIFLAVAHLSGTGETRIIWNHFGEMMFETVLFICAFIIIIIGYLYTYNLFKKKVKGNC
jgi:hypothetical protein